MAATLPDDNVASDDSTTERERGANTMNLILAEYAARHRSDSLLEEAASDRLVALATGPKVRTAPSSGRFARTASRLRLVLRGAAA